MTEIVLVTLENEMDLVLAQKKSIAVAEMLKFSGHVQTAFATAILEVGREVIDRTNSGSLLLSIQQSDRNFLRADIKCDARAGITPTQEGIGFAKRLVADLTCSTVKGQFVITLRLNIPRYIPVNLQLITEITNHFQTSASQSPYEELKTKNVLLLRVKEKQEQELEQSRQFDQQKNEFISIASHELKTPVTTIKAYAQLAEASDDFDAVKIFLSKINAQADKLNTLIGQLLDISKMETGRLEYHKEQINFDTYLQETVASLRSLYGAHKVDYQWTGDRRDVLIDKLRMEQVMSNLLGNAAKYSAPHSAIAVSCVSSPTTIHVSVNDQGIGITTENVHSVFEKFFREEDASRSYSGFGMGLYITKSIVEAHEGKIWVESTKGVGSSFTFTLPAVNKSIL